MINLRYHIVSIVAVFLALGIGVALGSTFIDSAVVSRLESNINGLQDDADRLQADVDTLTGELAAERADREAFEERVLPVMAGGRLDEIPVVVLAVDGVDDAALDVVDAALRGSDADYRGVLRFSSSLDTTDAANRSRLARVVGSGVDPRNAADVLRAQLVEALVPPEPEPVASVLGQLSSDLGADVFGNGDAPPRVSADTAVDTPTVLQVLAREDLIDYRPGNAFVSLDQLTPHGTRYVVLSGTGAELAPDQLLVPLLADMAAVAGVVPAVAGDIVTGAEPDGGSLVLPVLADDGLRAQVSTVDSVERFEGVLAVLAALDDLPRIGHYGFRDGATGTLP